ncbi:MAG: ClpX C4-type zinc finger protein [Gaiellales bacterium]
MANSGSSASRWRVTARGRTSSVPSHPRLLWAKGETVNAHLWAETVAPNSEFVVERLGTQGAPGDSAATVSMTVTVNAADASEAQSTVRLLLHRAMPSVGFSDIVPEEITGRHVRGPHSEPLCSFCGIPQRQAKKLIAGPGIYICDGCVEAMVEILREDAEPSTDA